MFSTSHWQTDCRTRQSVATMTQHRRCPWCHICTLHTAHCTATPCMHLTYTNHTTGPLHSAVFSPRHRHCNRTRRHQATIRPAHVGEHTGLSSCRHPCATRTVRLSHAHTTQCVCVCVRERERGWVGRERQRVAGEKERERNKERARAPNARARTYRTSRESPPFSSPRAATCSQLWCR